MLRLIDPTELNEQQARGMKLHILESGKYNNKSILEMVEAGKNTISVPILVEDLVVVIKAFFGLASILFGMKSSLPVEVKKLYRVMEINRLLL